MPGRDRTVAASADFVKDVQRRLWDGHNYVVMQLLRSRKPRNWDRVRVFPGVYGRCIGQCDDPRYFLVDVPIGPLAVYLGISDAA